MNQVSSSAPEEGIIEKILSDGKAQAKRLIDGAKRSQDAETGKAEREAERMRKEILGQAERRARTIRSKERAIAHIEAKRLLLRAREEAISKVFKTIEQELAKLKQDPRAYKQVLCNLAAEALAAIGESEVVLKVSQEDHALVDDAFLADVTGRLRQAYGSDIKIEVKPDSAFEGGGCVAMSKHGRIVFDNTFRRRLERMKPVLRSLIVREVLKSDV